MTLALLLLGGAAALFGLAELFAAGMSDAPAEGSDMSKQGCLVFALGLALAVLALWLRH